MKTTSGHAYQWPCPAGAGADLTLPRRQWRREHGCGRHRAGGRGCGKPAALALWGYAQRSATWALEATASDPLARQIHAALTHQLPDGLTRTQLRDLLHRNPTTSQLDQALNTLANDGKITSSRVLTTGRPAELWTAAQAPGA